MTAPTVGTLPGIAINLTRVSYNPSPAVANCYKIDKTLQFDMRNAQAGARLFAIE